MSTQPCCVASTCFDPSNPIANLTAENPDPEIFIGYNFGGGVIGPPNLGWNFVSTGCVGSCLSTISQADADLCAQGQQVLCDTGNPNKGGGGGGWKDPNGNPPPVFGNAAQHCDILCPDGLTFRFNVSANQFQSFSQAYSNLVAQSVACLAGQTERMCLSSLPNGCLNQAYSGEISSEGGTEPFTFSMISGSLPPGLFLSITDQGFALIEGTPTTPGNFSFTVRLTDRFGIFMQKTYTIAILGITNSPTSGTLNSAYNFSFTAAGGTPPYTYSIVAGALPAGLSMDSSGNITGTPTAAGTTGFSVSISDSSP